MEPTMNEKKEADPQTVKKNWPQRILHILLPLVIIGAGYWGYTLIKKPGAKPQRRPPVAMVPKVTVKTVYPEDHAVSITALGTVVASRELTVKSQVSGEVIKMNPDFTPGSRLSKGAELLRIDPADYQLALTRKERAVTEAEYQLKLEESSRDVAQQEWELLKESGPLPDDLDSGLALREPQIKKARADLKTAKAELTQAKRDLGRTIVKVPFNVLVLEKRVETGSSVSVNEALAELVGTDEYWVEATVPLNRLDRVPFPATSKETGPPATVLYRDRYIVSGRVTKLLSDMGEKGQMARVLIAIADPLGSDAQEPASQPMLLINEFVQVEIDGKPLTAAYKIPRTAMRDNQQVWLADDKDQLVIKPIKIIWQDDENVYVADGLSPGDRLIDSSIATPVSNMKLQINEAAPPSEKLEVADSDKADQS